MMLRILSFILILITSSALASSNTAQQRSQTSVRINPITSTEWLNHFSNTMNGPPDSLKTQIGGTIPFPDSYAGASSFAGIVAALNGTSQYPGSGNQFFTQGLDQIIPWLWIYAAEGHSSTATNIEIADGFTIVRRASTGTYQVLFKGYRGLGQIWDLGSNEGQYGAAQDITTDPNKTIIKPSGNTGYELWPLNNPLATGSITSRAAFSDFNLIITGFRVRVVGPDKVNSRFIATMGMDLYRSDAAGRRSDSAGYPLYVMDGGGARWRMIEPSGEWQWVIYVGIRDIARYNGVRPPWGNWGGDWPWNIPPQYGISFAQLQNEMGSLFPLLKELYVITPSPY